MAASFPTTVATETAGITVGNPVTAASVDSAWLEIIAIENVLKGSTTLAASGVNLNLKSGATGAVPIAVQGFSGQTADIIQAGSNAAANDRMSLSAGGKLTLPVTGTNGGVSLGTGSNVWTSGTDLLSKPQADATAAIKQFKADGTTVVSTVDTSNKRMSIGDSTVPSTTLHLNAGTAATTAALGIQFGNDASNLYRSAALTVKTDNNFNVAGTLLFGSSADVGMSRTGVGIVTLNSTNTFRLTQGFIDLSGDGSSASIIKATKAGTGGLTDNWYQTTLIGAETSFRFAVTAGGTLSWTEGAASPTTLGLVGGNTGLTTNKSLNVGSALNVTGLATLTGAATLQSTLAVTGAVTLSSSLAVSTFIQLGGGPKLRAGTTDDTYSGTDTVRVQTKDLEVRSTSGATRLVLSRPDGTRRFIRLDNDDQIIIEAS